jgi:rhamnosyltransferase
MDNDTSDPEIKIGLFIPTYNAGLMWNDCLKRVAQQDVIFYKKLVIDSSSNDNTVAIASDNGFDVITIDKNIFDHGGTRQRAVNELGDCDIILYITQDALLESSSSVRLLLSAFKCPDIAAAYGKQIPSSNATLTAAHSRLFNYPSESKTKGKSEISSMGIKTAFCSNSFAAYRVDDLNLVGGFAKSLIFGEDMQLAGRLILLGKKIRYVAESKIYHSHNYSYLEEFRRSFDIGVFHSKENWILKSFGRAEGEGLRFLRSEMNYLMSKNMMMIPDSILRIIFKYFGYRLGLIEEKLPKYIKAHLSMNAKYWSL